MNIEKWAEKINHQVYKEWKTKHNSWDPGFKTFNGPVRKNPPILIISYNPGGIKKSFEEDRERFENGDFSVPKTFSYVVKTHPMAVKMQDFFRDNDNLLKNSMHFPILFFRSKNVKTWKSIPLEKRREMECFCYEKSKEILTVIEPKILLILGLMTYKRLKKYMDFVVKNEVSIKGKNKRKIAYKSEWNNIPTFCMMHPTGSRINKNEWNKIKHAFFTEIIS